MSQSNSLPSSRGRLARLLPAGQRAGEGSLSAAAYIESDNIVKLVRVERGGHPEASGHGPNAGVNLPPGDRHPG
jgi:hypothetical protein